MGNEDLKSGKQVLSITPGHSASVGVPRRLFCVSSALSEGSPDIPEDLENFINLRVTWEKRLAGTHLCEYASNRPHIDTSRVLTSSKQDLWRSVPESDNFVGICAKGNTEGASKTKIGKLEIAIAVDEQILGLQIAMQHSMAVTVSNTFTQLTHELLYHCITQAQSSQVWSRPFRQGFSSSSIRNGERLHVLLQIEVKELEDEVKLVAIGMNNVEEADDVWVVHLLEKRDLTNRSTGDSFILGFKTNLLKCDNSIGVQQILGLVDNSVSS